MEKILTKGKDYVKLPVDLKLYPLNTVYSAGYVFLDRAYIYLDKDTDSKICVWLFPKDKKEDYDKLGMDFYNELINYANYFTGLKANSETLKMLMQRTLFSVAPTLSKEAEDKEIEDLIKELEEEELKEQGKKKAKAKK